MSKESDAFRKAIAPVGYTVLSGKILAIDPGSNHLGWAIFRKGKLVESGVCHAQAKSKPHTRIIDIAAQLEEVVAKTSIDLLCVEKLFRYNPSLVWSVGAVIQAMQPSLFVEVPIRIWQERLKKDYVKTDEADAISIGEALIYHASKL